MNQNQKYWIIFSLIIVFIIGVVAGVFLDNNVLDKQQKPRKKRNNTARFPTLCSMAEELSLSETQQAQIQDIFKTNDKKLKAFRGQIHKQFVTIRSSLIDEINKILDDEQKHKFEAMIERYLSQRRKELEERSQRSKRSRNTSGEKK